MTIRNKGRWIGIFVAITLVFGMLTMMVTDGFKNWNPYGWFDNDKVCEHVYEDGECTECGEKEVVA